MEKTMSDTYYYLTEKDIIREGDEEYLYNHELEEWGWYEVSVLSMGEHFQTGLDIRIRRKRKQKA
jgi:hypothetical protein